jgi:phenylalanyl-tRNA synthetase beta chain
MPTIIISQKDLNKLAKKQFTTKQISEEAILQVKGEVDDVQGDEMKVEIGDTNRPELWSTEGIARELRARYGTDTGVPKYEVSKPKIEVIVDPKLAKIRPQTVCAVVRGVNMTTDALNQLIQLQEKVCETYGRKRRDVAIGVYDMHKISPPIEYKAVHPDKLKFTPLEVTSERTLRQILAEHPKGKEYAHLLEGHDAYPVFIDKAGEVLSMPPIINSNHTGKVTGATEDLFIECSGSDKEFLMPALNVMVTALAERGGKIEAVTIRHGNKTFTTPDLTPKTITVKHEDIERMAGMKLSKIEVVSLLKRARYDATPKANVYNCAYPAYRQDIMHPADVIEDILIAYGYQNMVPELPKIASLGSVLKEEKFARAISEMLIGQGAQEIMSYTLTNENNLHAKMRQKNANLLRIENPVSQNWSVFRTWLLPSVVEFLSQNTRSEYPQKVFEIGRIVVPDASAETKSHDPRTLAFCSAGLDADFTKARQTIDSIINGLGAVIELKPTDNESFVQGRTASIHVNGMRIGTIGEIHPEVLQNWGIPVPVAAFEINLDLLYEVTQCREKSK